MLISPKEGLSTTARRKLHTVLQNEAAECGLACLAMVAGAFGYEVTLPELRRRFSVSSKGMGLRALLSVSDALELAGRPVKLELEDFGDLKKPAVLHWNLNHFVVLEKVRGDRLLIHDPARGQRWIERSEADRSFTGIAVEFTPTPAFTRRKDAERVRLGDLFLRVHGLIPSMAQMFLLAAIMQMFALFMPILNQLVVDEAITKGDLGLLEVLAGSMVLLLLTTTGIKMLQGFVGLYMGTQMSFQMRTNLLRHTLRLPVSWFEKRHVGDILSRFSSLQPVQDVLLNAAPAVVLNTIMAVAALIMMIIYAPLLAALEVLSVLVMLAIRLVSFPYLRQLIQQGLHLDAKVQTTFLETIRGARTFKLFGHERERVAMWQNEQARSINNQVRLARFGLWGGSGSTILAGIQQIIIWFLGARMVIHGDLTLGMLFAFQAYTSQFGGAAGALVQQLFTFRTMKVHLERLADVIHADEEPGLGIVHQRDAPIEGAIEVRNLSFRYADHEPFVLKAVNLAIRPGEFLCLQGPSGQGKTTLLKLMLGFEDPDEGEVLIDGVPLRKFGVTQFRTQVGAVLQDDQLFAGSVADNIAFFDLDASQDGIEQAARAAFIHDEISRLPMGYQTFTGDLGSSLSGGQRQRILLARALYRKPRILFLDEGTANLDPAAEHEVMRAIQSLPITRVVIAHRPGAAAGASRMVVVAGSALHEMSLEAQSSR